MEPGENTSLSLAGNEVGLLAGDSELRVLLPGQACHLQGEDCCQLGRLTDSLTCVFL